MSRIVKLSIPAGSTCLEAVWHPSSLPTQKVFIISHGFRGHMDGSSRADLLGEEVSQLGYHVLRYHFTPCQNLTTQIMELSAVAQFARKHYGNDLYLLGRSMGGSASLVFAHEDKEVKGLCLWSTPGDLKETFQRALGGYYQTLADGRKVVISDDWGTVTLQPDFLDFERYRLYEYIHQMNIPLLILHGSKDEVVPLAQAEKMYRQAQEPKKMIILDGVDHQLTGKTAEARRSVCQWLESLA